MPFKKLNSSVNTLFSYERASLLCTLRAVSMLFKVYIFENFERTPQILTKKNAILR